MKDKELLSRAEYQTVKGELQVEFRRFVGEKTGREDLRATPDFMSEDTINPDWITSVRPMHKKVSTSSPGKLIFTKTGWKAEDPDSPIGKIEKLQVQAKTSLEQPENPTQQKKTKNKIKAELVEIFNGYAGKRFNGVRDVVDGKDFNGVTLTNLTSRSLRDWREKLVRTRYQTITPELFDRWEGTYPKSMRTPSQADAFLANTFREIVSAGVKHFTKETRPPKTLSNEASLLTELLSHFDAQGFIALANMFYGGDMKKNHTNVSAVAKMTEAPFPEGWQQFNGSSADFKKQRKWVTKNRNATAYMFMTNCKINTKKKAQENLAAIRAMTS